MSTSTFYNNIGAHNEQGLLEDLIIESIKIYGIDMYYLVRIPDSLDPLFGQSDRSTFNAAFEIEFYVRSYQGFEGEGNLFSKFGLEIRDQITFTVARRVFNNTIGKEMDLIRPREGDLIYYPLNKKSFEVKFVQDKPIHYPLGILPSYDLYCELYEYSNEIFDTGIPEIDAITGMFSTNIYDNNPLMTDEGKIIKTCMEAGGVPGKIIMMAGSLNYDFAAAPQDNIDLQEQVDELIDFTETDPFSENWKDEVI